MTTINQSKPIEIIVHEQVQDDPATVNFLNQCPTSENILLMDRI